MEEQNNKFFCGLKCFTCGKLAHIETECPPQFAFEVANWAKDIGWVGVIDMYHSRSLVFCSESCCEKAKTKKGTFRLRSPKVSTELVQDLKG